MGKMRRLRFHALPFLALGAGIAIACGSSSSGDDDAVPTGDGGSTDGTTVGDGNAPRDGSAGDGSADAAVFTPLDFGSRLVLWLDGSQMLKTRDAGIDASPVITDWNDLSTSHNNAHIFEGEPRELLGDAGIHGLPVVNFDGNSGLSIPESASLVWGTGDFSLYVVFRYQGVPLFSLVAGKYDPVVPFPGPNLYANYFIPCLSTNIAARLDSTHFVQTQDGGYDNDQMRVVGMRRTGTHLELRVDGVSNVTDDAGFPDGGVVDVSAPDASFYIGARPTGAQLKGDVAEVLGVKGTLSDADVEALEAYLKKKYGL
jgi:hypothetical protein